MKSPISQTDRENPGSPHSCTPWQARSVWLWQWRRLKSCQVQETQSVWCSDGGNRSPPTDKLSLLHPQPEMVQTKFRHGQTSSSLLLVTTFGLLLYLNFHHTPLLIHEKRQREERLCLVGSLCVHLEVPRAKLLLWIPGASWCMGSAGTPFV